MTLRNAGRWIDEACQAGQFVPPPVSHAAGYGVMWVLKSGFGARILRPATSRICLSIAVAH